MGLEQNNEQHYREVPDKFHDPIEDYEMTTRDYVLRPTANLVTGPFTLTLPPVSEAKGRWYSIIAHDADGINTITITDNSDSECWLGDIVLNNKCDRCLLYSDGLAWQPIFQGGWPQMATTVPTGTTTAPPTTGQV